MAMARSVKSLSSSVAHEKRDQRVEARLTKSQKALLENAAALSGTSLSKFVVAAAQRAAEDMVEQRNAIVLSKEDVYAFFEALANPPLPTEEYKKAAADYTRLILSDKA